MIEYSYEDHTSPSTAEKEAINRVVRLGGYYLHLRDFVDQYRFAGTFASPDDDEDDECDYLGLPSTVRDRVLGSVSEVQGRATGVGGG